MYVSQVVHVLPIEKVLIKWLASSLDTIGTQQETALGDRDTDIRCLITFIASESFILRWLQLISQSRFTQLRVGTLLGPRLHIGVNDNASNV